MSHCPGCGVAFQCGMVAQDAASRGEDEVAKPCWCMSFPPILAVPASDTGASCYCPQCLQALVRQQEAGQQGQQ